MSFRCFKNQSGDDSFVDFEFDDTPDDESLRSHEGEDIDALNEETFGIQADPDALTDLEQLSEEASRLRLDLNEAEDAEPCSSVLNLPDYKFGEMNSRFQNDLSKILPELSPKTFKHTQEFGSACSSNYRPVTMYRSPPRHFFDRQQCSAFANKASYDQSFPPAGFPFRPQVPNPNVQQAFNFSSPVRFKTNSEQTRAQYMQRSLVPNPQQMHFLQMLTRGRMPNTGPYSAQFSHCPAIPRWIPPHSHFSKTKAYPHPTTCTSNENYEPERPFVYRRRRQAGLPSEKTISDFAFNPFGGLMSKKESDWLISLQLRQCIVHGNQYEDDYYYMMWKKKHESLHPDSLNKSKNSEKSKNGLHSSTTPHHYEPPKFVGSLGKPSLSTAKNPRHLIDLDNDAIDDEEKVPTKQNSQAQRKLRTLFLLIENVLIQVFLCNDGLSKLELDDLHDDERETVKKEIKERTRVMIESPCFTDRLAISLLIPKGRDMFLRAIKLFPEDQQITALNNLFVGLSSIMKKTSTDDLNDSLLIKTLLEIFESYSTDALISISQFIPIEFYTDHITKGKHQFAFNLIFSFLLCLARRNCDLTANRNEPEIFKWLSGKYSSTLSTFNNLTNNLLGKFTVDECKIVHRWLMDHFLKYRGCVGQQIAYELNSLFFSAHSMMKS